MRKRILITGAAGFTGSHLAERLSKEAEVWGMDVSSNTENLSGILPDERLIRCDLLDADAVRNSVREIRPDVLFHLAAQSVPSVSFERAEETLKTNIFSTFNLLEAVKSLSPSTVFLNAGSGDEYGDVDERDLPVKETSEFRPENPYAVSKIAADMLTYQYWKSEKVKAVRLRPFNHYGPRQSERFVASSFAKQIAEIEAGIRKDKEIRVGNLESSRDFLHVRDVVRAYALLMEEGAYGEAYNVCSGRALRIRELLSTLLALSKEKIIVVEDKGKIRAKDSKAKYGDPAKLKALGWSEEITLKEGLEDLLGYWRGRFSGRSA